MCGRCHAAPWGTAEKGHSDAQPAATGRSVGNLFFVLVLWDPGSAQLPAEKVLAHAPTSTQEEESLPNGFPLLVLLKLLVLLLLLLLCSKRSVAPKPPGMLSLEPPKHPHTHQSLSSIAP